MSTALRRDEVSTVGILGGPTTLGELAAPLFLCAHLVVSFRPFDQILPMPGPVSSVLVPALGVCVLVVATNRDLGRVPVSFTFLGFVLWLGASLLWTESREFSLLLLRNELPSLVIVWFVVGTMRPQVTAATLLFCFTACGAWNLLAALVLPASASAGSGIDGFQRGLGGTFGHKNVLGIFMVLALTLVLSFERRVRPRRLLIVAFVVLILLTRSATAASGLLAMLAAFSWLTVIGSVRRSRDRVVLKLLAIASMVAAVLLILGLLPALVGIYGKDVTFSGRTEIWAATLEAIDERPIQGYGVGGVWYDGTSEVTRTLWERIGFGASHAHSGPLNLTLEAGLVGLGLYVLLVGRILRLAASCLKSPATSPYGRWAISTVAAILLMSLSEPLFRGPTLALVVIMWTVLARVMNEQRSAGPTSDAPHTVDQRRAAAMPL